MNVFLDSGHGGKDSGAINESLGLQEKYLTLSLVKKVAEILKQQGIIPIMSRATDITIKADQRTAIERANTCECAVSIHFNSHSNKNAAGIETWVHSNATNNTVKFGENMINNINSVLKIANRGVKKGYPSMPFGNFAINRGTNSTSMLLEVCFISNNEEITRYLKLENQVAGQIAKTILNFCGKNYIPISQEAEKPKIYDFEITNVSEVGTKLLEKNYLIPKGYRYTKKEHK